VALLNLDAFSNFQQVTLDDLRLDSALLSQDGQLLAATAGVPRSAGGTMATWTPFTRFLPLREQGSWQGSGLRAGKKIASFRVTRTRPLIVMLGFGGAAAHEQWWRDSRGRLGVGLAGAGPRRPDQRAQPRRRRLGVRDRGTGTPRGHDAGPLT
jgi:hypothetical protein